MHPRVTARPTFTQVFPKARGAITPATGGTAAPASGTPAYLQQAYDLSYLSQTKGGSQTVAIVDAYDDPTAESDLSFYRNFYGLPACTTANKCFTKVNQGGKTSPSPGADSGWQGEISLDLDAVSALCPNCKIILIEADSASSDDLQIAERRAATLGATQISNSWDGHGGMDRSAFTFPGVAVVASSGDDGYDSNPEYPAAFAGVNAAGGTTLSAASDHTGGRGFSESAWSLTGGSSSAAGSGCIMSISKPAYQPDTGCGGRSYADLSADADPATGLTVRVDGRWSLIGGTSLSSPLIAAYYALISSSTGHAVATTPQWPYDNRALLNDPITGSVGSCPASYTYICNAGVGYDGPTGIGSISGAVVTGPPGVGGPSVDWGSGSTTYVKSVGGDSVNLVGGAYPNGLDTTYYWQYGSSTDYGPQTTPVDLGAGRAPVQIATTLSGLTPGASYHYRLVASNSAGTTYGYDYVVTIIPAAEPPLAPTDPGDPGGAGGSSGPTPVDPVGPVDPVAPIGPGNLDLPTVSGTPSEGQVLSATTGQWAGSPTSIRYQWKRCDRAAFHCSQITDATGSTHRLLHADVGHALAVIVTAANSAGSDTASSSFTPLIGDAPAPPAPRLSALRLGSSSFAARKGTWLMLTLSSAATIRVAITEHVAGRRVGSQCRSGARHGTRCTATVTVRSLTFHGRTGRNRFALHTARLPHRRYLATVIARGAGATLSRKLTRSFTIAR